MRINRLALGLWVTLYSILTGRLLVNLSRVGTLQA